MVCPGGPRFGLAAVRACSAQSPTTANHSRDRERRRETTPETGEGGIRTRGRGLYPYDGLANRCLQPLGHLSKPSGHSLPDAVQLCKQINNSLPILHSRVVRVSRGRFLL